MAGCVLIDTKQPDICDDWINRWLFLYFINLFGYLIDNYLSVLNSQLSRAEHSIVGRSISKNNNKMTREDETRFRYIEHPSDVGFEAYGTTLEELFVNAALAMYSFMTDVDAIEATEERAVTVQAEDLYSLMFDWLDELLFLFESESLVMKRFDISVNESEFSIQGTCLGGTFDPERHDAGIIIKAVTYNMMEVKRNEQWHARVVLDV